MRKLCAVVLVVALLTVGCTSQAHGSKSARTTDVRTSQQVPTESMPSTQAQVPSTSSATSAATSPTSTAPPNTATQRITVRPVTSSGEPAPGYTVTNENVEGFTCTGETSPVAVSPNIRFCGFSATDTVACWKSSVPSTVLCLRNPLVRSLVRITYTGGFVPVAAPAHADPQTLVLDDDDQCQIRDGGAWSAVPSQPTWVGWYYCAHGKDIYGPRSGNGIDQTSSTWTVHAVAPSGTGAITSHSVTIAYFVGTA